MGVGIRGDGRRRPRRLAARGIGGALAGIALVAAMMVPVAVHAAAASVETATLAVNYRLAQPDGNMIAESYVAEMPTGSDYSVESPDIEGFALQDQSQATVAGTLDADRTVEVLYDYAEKSVGYTVEYVGVDSNGKTTVLATDTTGTAVPGATATVPSRAFEGYAQRTTDLTLVVTPDGKAKKTVYYEKAEGTVYVLFDTNGSYVAPVGLLAGERLDESDELKTSFETKPARAGYEFDGWMLDGEKVGSVADLPETMPAEDIVLTAAWAPGTSTYTVLYWFENIEDEGYTLNTGLNDNSRTAPTESAVDATADDRAKGETNDDEDPFYGFDYGHSDPVQVTGDGNAVLNLYYDREAWTINLYDAALGANTTTWQQWQAIKNSDAEPAQSFSGKYGAPLPDEFPSYEERADYYNGKCPSEFQDKGYSFVDLLVPDYNTEEDWGDANGGLNHLQFPALFNVEGAEAMTSGTMPATNLTLYAKWVPTTVTVKFDSCGGSEVDAQSVPYNGKATEPEEPTREGYEFTGWYTAAQGGDRWGFDRTVAEDTTLYAHWRGSSVGTVTVNHVMEGEATPFATEKIEGVEGATVVAEALVPQDTSYPADAYLRPDFVQKSVTVTGDPEKDVVTFTYVPASQRDYTVRYLESGTGAELTPAREVTTLNSYVTEVAKGVDGYSVDHEWIAQPVKDGDVITFWYTAGDPGIDPDPDQPEDPGDTPDPDLPEQPDPGETPDQPDPGETPDQPVRPAGDGGEKNDAALPATGDASLAVAPTLVAGCAAAALGLRAFRRR